MSSSPSLQQQLKQSQTVTMTPQLQQSLKLLQFSHLELTEYISEELEKNPLLTTSEAIESESADSAPSEGGEESGSDRLSESRESKEEMLNREEYENLWQGADVRPQVDNITQSSFTHNSEIGRIPSVRFDGEDGPSLEQVLSRDKTLKEHLSDQIILNIESHYERAIAWYLLDSLDEAGYFTGDLPAMCRQIGCKPEDGERLLSLLQQSDPPGVFARSLEECLMLQLKDRNHWDPAMETMLHHLQLLAERNFPKLQKLCKVTEEDLMGMIAEIRALNPKPGSNFESEVVHGAEPDVLVQEKPDGSWFIELNQDLLPKVLANRRYYQTLSSKSINPEEKKYVSEHWNNANWLVKALHQRSETLLKVSSEIIELQQDFFRLGIYHLRPLVYRDIAEKLGIHESTVGRAVANKHMHTPRGLLPLKYFFTSSVKGSLATDSADGDVVSSQTVKRLIKELVDSELPTEILSDDQLADLLQEKGVGVARRTIAKYREAMHIPSSVLRRRQKSHIKAAS